MYTMSMEVSCPSWMDAHTFYHAYLCLYELFKNTCALHWFQIFMQVKHSSVFLHRQLNFDVHTCIHECRQTSMSMCMAYPNRFGYMCACKYMCRRHMRVCEYIHVHSLCVFVDVYACK